MNYDIYYRIFSYIVINYDLYVYDFYEKEILYSVLKYWLMLVSIIGYWVLIIKL